MTASSGRRRCRWGVQVWEVRETVVETETMFPGVTYHASQRLAAHWIVSTLHIYKVNLPCISETHALYHAYNRLTHCTKVTCTSDTCTLYHHVSQRLVHSTMHPRDLCVQPTRHLIGFHSQDSILKAAYHISLRILAVVYQRPRTMQRYAVFFNNLQ